MNTVDTDLVVCRDAIDRVFGVGYAKKNPGLLGHLVLGQSVEVAARAVAHSIGCGPTMGAVEFLANSTKPRGKNSQAASTGWPARSLGDRD